MIVARSANFGWLSVLLASQGADVGPVQVDHRHVEEETSAGEQLERPSIGSAVRNFSAQSEIDTCFKICMCCYCCRDVLKGALSQRRTT